MASPTYKIITDTGATFALDQTNGIYLQEEDSHSSTPLQLDMVGTARRPGSKIVSSTYRQKKIPLSGTVVGSDWADLTTKLDALKLAVVSPNIKLVVDDAVNTRVYFVALDGIMTADRRQAIVHARFSLSLVATDPPFGYASDSSGNVTSVTALTGTNVTLDIYNATLNFLGSAPPEAKVKLTISTVGDLTGIDLVDKTNNRTLSIRPSSTMSNGDVIVIDTFTPSVKLNNDPVTFTGQFPDFKPGASDISIYAYTSSGLAVDQQQNLSNSQVNLFKTTDVYAQSFLWGTSGPLSRFQIAAKKIGSPTGNISVEIRADSSNTPAGTLLATVPLTPADIPVAFNFINAIVSGLPQLTAATKYWLKFTVAAGCDVDNYYQLRVYTANPDGYSSGSLRKSANSGSSYADIANTDMLFKVFRSVNGQRNDTPDANTANSYSDSFANTTYKDVPNTTAAFTGSGSIFTNGTANNQAFSTENNSSPVFGSSFRYQGSRFTQGTNKELLESVVLKLANQASPPSSNIVVELYDDIYDLGGGNYFMPTTPLATSTTSLNLNAITTTATNYTFNFPPNTVLQPNTNYIIAVSCAGATSASRLLVRANWTGVTTYSGAENAWTFSLAFDGTKPILQTYTPGRHVTTINTRYYNPATIEYAQSTAIDATDSDLLAVAMVRGNQSVPTGGSSSFQFSPNGGTTWQTFSALTSAPADSDFLAVTAVGSDLRYKIGLAGKDATPASLDDITLYTLEGITLDSTTKRGSMSFSQPTTGNLAKFDLYLKKIGAPGNITIRIETDSSGSPSGTLVHPTDATLTLTASAVATSFGWVSFSLPNPVSFTGGATYHIVISAAATVDASNNYQWLSNNGGYASGSAKKSTNSGSSYTAIASGEDMLFRTFGAAGSNFAYNSLITYKKRYL